MLEQYIFLFIFLVIGIFGLICCIFWMRTENKIAILSKKYDNLFKYTCNLEQQNEKLVATNTFYKNALEEKDEKAN